jgi:hypothetical protein
MRFLVFAHDDVECRSALYKLSEARGRDLLAAGAEPIDANKLRLSRPADADSEADARVRRASMDDWISVHVSTLPPECWPTLGKHVRITTKQLATA